MSCPPEPIYNYDALFRPDEASESEGALRRRRTAVAKQALSFSVRDEDGEDENFAARDSEAAAKSHELWLRVGETAPGRPVLQTWETRHRSENYWFVDQESGDSRPTRMPRQPINESAAYKRSDDQRRTSYGSRHRDDDSETISEGDLVRDALYALQGLPAAVAKLENLSRKYCASAADLSARSMSTFFANAVTTSALGQVLAVVASAGRVRCQLDTFVGYFLDDLTDPYDENKDKALPRVSRRARRRKVKNKRKAAETLPTEMQLSKAKSPVSVNSFSDRIISHQCLVNQAFASAVKGILRGHSAALDTLAASVSVRRAHEAAEGMRERDPGPAVGYKSHDTSLLEFYLHTRELRIQLHTLAFICLVRRGEPGSESRAGDSFSGQIIPNAESNGSRNSGTGDDCSHPLAQTFDDFPRGADLLTYLYDQLTEMDPLRLELLRFLFECAYEPYADFIQSWLYEGSVRDPYGEFFLHLADTDDSSSKSGVQSKLSGGQPVVKPELRRDVRVPKFMERIWTSLIRAGEQLQVLLKLADTSHLAQQMSKNTRASGMLWPWTSAKSLPQSAKNSPILPRLAFSKKKLDEAAMQRNMRGEQLRRQFDALFSEMSLRHKKRGSRSGSLSMNDHADGIKNGRTAVEDPEFQQQTFQEPPISSPSRRESSEHGYLSPSEKSPESKPSTGKDDDSIGVESSASDVNSRDVSRANFINRDLSASLTETESDKAERRVTSSETADVLDVQHLHQSPVSARVKDGSPDSTEGSEKGRAEVHPCVFGHQEGPCWPTWGSLVNPFFVHADGEDSSPTSYLHPSFLTPFEHFNVTEQLLSNSLSLSVSRGPSLLETDNIIGPSWFKRLESDFKDRLSMGLDAQLALSSWGQGEANHASVPFADEDAGEYRGRGWTRMDPQLSCPVVFSWADGSKEEALDPLASEKGSDDTLNSLLFLPSNSGDTFHLNKPILLKSSQIRPHDATFSLHSSSRSETAAAPLTPQSTSSRDSAWASIADSGIWRRKLRTYPWGTGEKNISERHSTESCLNLVIPERRNAGVLADEETTDNLRDLENISVPELQGELSEEACCETTPKVNGVSQYYRREADHSGRAVTSESVETGKEPGFANWEEYLRSFHRNAGEFPQVPENCIREDEVSADEEVPHSIMVSKCIADEVLCQYYFVSTLTVQLLQEGLCMQDHCAALRRYFFMEQGDWADYFSAALFQHRWGPVLGQHQLVEVQGLLEAAFQRSSCDADEYAGRFHFSFQNFEECSDKSDNGFSTSSIIDCYRLDAFDFIALQYSVDWPLSLILTNHSLGLYNEVFIFLMRIKITVHALGDIWQRLQVIDRRLQKARPSSTYHMQRSRFRTLQQFRQQIYHFVTTVQRYVESKLLNVWSKFLQDIRLEATDMQDLETVHRTYVEAAINECFLCEKASGVKECIDSVLQCVLDFSSYLKKASFQRREDLDMIDDDLVVEVRRLRRGFQSTVRELHHFHSKPGSQMNLNDLWMILDYNGFHTALCTGQI